MAGFQDLRVNRKVDFRGAVKVGVGDPITKGKVIYVDSRSWGVGASGRDGLDPNYPLNKVDTAVGLCTAGNGDYIFVLDGYDNDATTITVDISNIHIIGLGGVNHRAPFVWLLGGGDGTKAVFTLQGSNAANCEIAGFTLGADASRPCITTITGGSTELVYAWIHHNAFAASLDASFVAQDGILEAAGTGLDGTLIEDNVFGNQIGRDGVRFVNFYGGLIRNNLFKGITTRAIEQTTGGAATGCPDIIGNKFFQKTACDKGSSIYIVDAGGGLIDDNHTAEDNSGTTGNNPYFDSSSGTLNAWGVNWVGDAVGLAATS
jgi:hypothetical protein